MMSSTNAMANQQDPIKKHEVGTNTNCTQNAAVVSMNKASKYPDGVFQLNGILEWIENKVHT